jgi:hypothetical protein
MLCFLRARARAGPAMPPPMIITLGALTVILSEDIDERIR